MGTTMNKTKPLPSRSSEASEDDSIQAGAPKAIPARVISTRKEMRQRGMVTEGDHFTIKLAQRWPPWGHLFELNEEKDPVR